MFKEFISAVSTFVIGCGLAILFAYLMTIASNMYRYKIGVEKAYTITHIDFGRSIESLQRIYNLD